MKIFLLFFFIFISCSQLPKKRSDKLSILQGVTNSKEVEFSIVTKKNKDLRFELRDEIGEVLHPDETKIVSRNFSDYIIYKAVFTRNNDKDYNLYVYKGEKVIDQRLIGRGQRAEYKLKLAVVSCMDDYYSKYFNIWKTLADQNPEYLLMIGDNIYADISGIKSGQSIDPETIWERYVDARLSYPIFFQQKLIPVHAVWNDHDYGMNKGHEHFKYKQESKDIFDAFYAQDLSEDDWAKGLGIGGRLSLGDFNLYFLDGRSFRSPDKMGPHLGLDQSAWFYSKIREESTPSFIIKGDQFFGGQGDQESFEGNHPDQFQDFINELKQISTPFIFISGDRHKSEIMQFPRTLFGRPSFEITSGPLHSKIFGELEEARNPWRVVANKSHVNFTIIDNLAEENHWFLDIQNFGEKGEIYYRREVAVYIKDLQDNLKEVRKRRIKKRSYRRIRSLRKKR